ncbi:MAG: ParB N-terminal domain-containing protein [Lachnospiraceae bacterium]|nr:ParB N-terminal domain-containing protein [Lachnospiraceae bacterium]
MGNLLSRQKLASSEQTKSANPSLHIRNIDYRQLEESTYQYRELTPESVHRLANIILLDGRVWEPLIVRKKNSDTFEILSGHKRYRACKYLVEELQEESFSMIPCCVMDLDNVRAEFAVYSTNSYDQKTPYEITKEIEGMKHLLDAYPDTFHRPKGKRTVQMIAEELHLTPTTVKVHQAISNRLGTAGMEQYKEGNLTKEAAYQLSKLPKENQEEVLKEGITSAKEIKKAVKKTISVSESDTKPEQENPVSDSDTEESEPGTFNFSGYKKEKTKPKQLDQNKNKIINPQEETLQEAVHIGICPFCKRRLIFESGFNFCGYCGHEVLWILEEGGVERKYGYDQSET